MSAATLPQQIDSQLARMLAGAGGGAAGGTLLLTADDGVTVDVHLAAAETLGVALSHLSLDVPSLAGADQATLEQWGRDLCARVTYLLEGLGPLEYDPQNDELLIRSVPPTRDAGATSYFEVMLSASGAGAFTLARYRTEPGVSRTREDVPLTREVLKRLVRDAVETIP
ncbi:hypothetical protein [Alienimonas sp. DA493]|uniref:hypothetical protein n=1 Tax=Alienimonas sp. DA493 TaxID=3373605 RepID=UPI00375496D0